MASKERYYREKEAAKLVAFYEAFNGFISLYAEMRLLYPDLAEVVEKRHPFLLSLSGKKKVDAMRNNDA